MFVLDKNRWIETSEMTPEMIGALESPLRREIIQILSLESSYASEVAKELEISKQKAYYHFNKLSKAGLIEKGEKKNLSGGEAQFFRLSSEAFTFIASEKQRKAPVKSISVEVKIFLEPLVMENRLNGKIVAGSPLPHGEQDVRARDGHLTGEVAAALGNYCVSEASNTLLDTEVSDEEIDQNLMLLGGPLTNMLSKRLNSQFSANFDLDSFPYHGLETPENSYEMDNIGIVAKCVKQDFSAYLVAGIRSQGTRAAVRALYSLEEVLGDYEGGDFYAIIEGKDLDSDGEVDDFEVLERST